ncbi:MAG: hypothetical protein HXY37_01145 [Chloroflexi bacterium]|nr:hypothetical protein [Chloroflexota bacterium]
MSTEAAFATLEQRLHALLEALTGLHTTVVVDRPLQGQPAPQDTPALVDIIGAGAENLIGWTMEALVAVQESHPAARRDDIGALRDVLSACHERIMQVNQGLLTELMSYERVADLARVGRTRGGEWRVWALSVKQTLERCREPLFDLQEAQFECWRELAEHAGQRRAALIAHERLASGRNQTSTSA